jgi:hypothetical protein
MLSTDFFHRLIRKIDSAEQQEESARMTVRDCQENAVIFMGHRMRVINQQVSIQKLLNVMKMNCVSYGTKECVITIDYKMKLDPI